MVGRKREREGERSEEHLRRKKPGRRTIMFFARLQAPSAARHWGKGTVVKTNEPLSESQGKRR